MIEEVKTIYDANLDRPYIVNPKTIDSKVKRCIRVTLRYVLLRYFIILPIVIFSKNPTLTGNDPSKVSSGKGRFVIVEPRRKLKFATCKYTTDSLFLTYLLPTMLIAISTLYNFDFYSTQCRNDPCNHVEYSCEGELARTNWCYHPMKYGSKCRNDIYLDTDTDTEFDVPPRYRVSSVCGNLHIFDSCPVCFKYKCYFSNECDGISPDNAAHPQKDHSISQQQIST